MILADFFKKKPTSGSIAKNRLKLVLVSDRANCSPDIMEQIKNDIINVLSKYLEIDQEGLDIKISQTDVDGDASVPALFANIPIRDMKSEARKAEKKAEKDTASETNKTEDVKAEEKKDNNKNSNNKQNKDKKPNKAK
ncbi:MAG: cell division topological specificity factor MinE [Lachnospiraceae bacterium]|nr:cell division topological specificity factor MinE [Lachnospiraceae bacterium]